MEGHEINGRGHGEGQVRQDRDRRQLQPARQRDGPVLGQRPEAGLLDRILHLRELLFFCFFFNN